jgi:SAM-dependent methyltransferase
MPEIEWDMSQHPLFVASREVLHQKFGQELSEKTILDLGCLEGGYTVEFARLGMNATGLEVRTSNFQNCEIVRRALNLPNLHFIQDDCWNIEQYGHFDVIFCSGLLYHLHDPVAFLKLLRAQCDLLILDTHFATEAPTNTFALSDLTVHEGLRGRWYFETPEDKNPKSDAAKWTSWGNHQSFWPLEKELIRAVSSVGFKEIDLNAFTRPIEEQRRTIVAS